MWAVAVSAKFLVSPRCTPQPATSIMFLSSGFLLAGVLALVDAAPVHVAPASPPPSHVHVQQASTSSSRQVQQGDAHPAKISRGRRNDPPVVVAKSTSSAEEGAVEDASPRARVAAFLDRQADDDDDDCTCEGTDANDCDCDEEDAGISRAREKGKNHGAPKAADGKRTNKISAAAAGKKNMTLTEPFEDAANVPTKNISLAGFGGAVDPGKPLNSYDGEEAVVAPAVAPAGQTTTEAELEAVGGCACGANEHRGGAGSGIIWRSS